MIWEAALFIWRHCKLDLLAYLCNSPILFTYSVVHPQKMTDLRLVNCVFLLLTLNVRGPSYLGLTRSLRRQDISSHDIDYIEYVGPSLTWGSILSTCVKSMWRNDIKCKCMFMFPQKNLAHKGLTSQSKVRPENSGLLTNMDFNHRFSQK